jgi:hypothetical protein
MAQLVTMTVEVRGAAFAGFLTRAARPMSEIVHLFTPRGAELMCVGIAVLIPKLIRVKAR